MIERALILLGLVGVVGAVWALLRARAARRLRQLAETPAFVGLVPPGRPAVVAFTLPSCAECRVLQAPALQRLGQQLGAQASLQTLRADEHTALIDRLGIFTVPATAVLDRAGRLRFLNQGFADEARLAKQLAVATAGRE